MIRRQQQRADGHAGSQRVGGKVHALRALATQHSLDTAPLASSIEELIADPNVSNGYLRAVGALQPGGTVEARDRLGVRAIQEDPLVSWGAKNEMVTGDVNRRAQTRVIVPFHRVVDRR